MQWTEILRAQSSLVLSSGGVAPGGFVALNLTLSSVPGSQPAGLQWTLVYPASDISSWTVTGGPALSAAGKTITCATGFSPDRGNIGFTCLAIGLNTNPIADGVVAIVTVSLAGNAPATSIGLGNALGASPGASGIGISATGGTVTPVILSSLACTPATLSAGTTGNCTIALNSTSGGATISLSSNKPGFQLPASVVIPAGDTSATFGFTSTRGLSGRVVLSASLGGVTKTATFQVKRPDPAFSMARSETSVYPGSPVSLSCKSRSLIAGQSVICELQSASPATPDSLDIAISSSSLNVRVPEILSLRAGRRRISFEVDAEAFASQEVALITADTGSSVALENLTVIPASSPRDAQASGPSDPDGRTDVPRLTGLRNAAGGGAPSACSPGSAATVEGVSLLDGDAPAFSDFGGDTITLGGSQLLVNGSPAVLRYASPRRLSFLCPDEAPGTPLEIHVETSRATSNRLYSSMAETSPGVLSVDGTGTGQALATHGNSADVAALPNFRYQATAAEPGDLLFIQVTGVDCSEGGGGVDWLGVRLGGRLIRPSSVERMAVDAGICQVSFRVPPGVSGYKVPLTVESLRGDRTVVTSNSVSLAVEADR